MLCEGLLPSQVWYRQNGELVCTFHKLHYKYGEIRWSNGTLNEVHWITNDTIRLQIDTKVHKGKIYTETIEWDDGDIWMCYEVKIIHF